jgi:two-component system sensor histidine kinase RegB
MLQLIQLRWIAVFGQVTTIAVVTFFLGIDLPLLYMLRVLACLVVFNIVSHLRWSKKETASNGELFLAILVDISVLTIQLFLSGGVTNPFVFLYLLQVILSSVLLETWSTWIIVIVTSACLASLSLFSKDLALLGGRLSSIYVEGLLICFTLDAALLVFFVTRISKNLRAGDAKLADLRQRASEQDHIIRMGLLASGAAHELGTPLATLSVILGDWRRMPHFSENEELLEEINEMQAQLQRCKNTVSSILLSAGEARGESSVKTTVGAFLNELVEKWCKTRIISSFIYENEIKQDIPVVFDSTLKQMIYNILDNALEASPGWVRLKATCESGEIVLAVTDSGPGFRSDVLSQLGKPYQSTKDNPGSGLGLFFVVNVARKLGGTVTARNKKERGAIVVLTLPLSAIIFDKKAIYAI